MPRQNTKLKTECVNKFGIKGAAGCVVAQLDNTKQTEPALIRAAQKQSLECLIGTRYEHDDTVECPALRDLARDRKINHEGDGGPHYWVGRRYWL
jgi:hypothetical protein